MKQKLETFSTTVGVKKDKNTDSFSASSLK